MYGTADRGVRIKCANRALNSLLGVRTSSLARHGVKGDEDLTMRFLPSAGGLKGYKVQGDAHSFWMLNFRRALPMEDPEATTLQVERGQSIFAGSYALNSCEITGTLSADASYDVKGRA